MLPPKPSADDRNPLHEDTVAAIYSAARLLRFRLSKVFQQTDPSISPEQWAILVRLHETPGLSQGQLADPRLNDHPNITRLIDGLAQSKLVTRHKDPNDRRRYLIYLTEKARVLIRAFQPKLRAEQARIFANLSEGELRMLLAVLETIEGNLAAGLEDE